MWLMWPKAMGMKLIAYDPYISNERAEQIGCRLVELDVLIQEADYITLHIPRTEETANLINAEVLGKMKPTARIINCARGGLIDEAASRSRQRRTHRRCSRCLWQ